MLEPAVIAVRLLQYIGVAVLFGTALFALYAAPPPARARGVVGAGAALLALASLLAIGAQASLFAGSFAQGFEREPLVAVATSMDLGKAALARALAAVLALAALFALKGRTAWIATAAFGCVAAASLAWLGHGAAAENRIELAADVVHVLAASAWLGALAGFLLLSCEPRSAERDAHLHRALRGFSRIGTVLVAMLVASGLANAWFLVGPEHVGELLAASYGRILALKLVLFALMLLFAAGNRWRLTPALGRGDRGAATTVGRSVALEAGLGLAVLGLVAWLGTLEPPGLG